MARECREHNRPSQCAVSRRVFLAGAPYSIINAAEAQAPQKTAVKAKSGASAIIGTQEFVIPDIIAPMIRDITGAAQPYADEARAELQAILSADEFRWPADAPRDRWGRMIADPGIAGNGEFVSAMLVERGAARVDPQSDRIDHIQELLNLEEGARLARRGLWRLAPYRVRRGARPDDVAPGAFHIVEGVVRRAAKRQSRWFLNFGDDFRSDVTATARASVARRWPPSTIDWRDAEVASAQLTGASVRVRGWTQWINGPSIDLTHAQQVEILEKQQAG